MTAGSSARTSARDDFHRLYEQHADTVARYATSLVGRDLRDDVVAETFLRAWSALGSYRDEGRPMVAWLLRICRNIAFDHHRREARRPTPNDLDDGRIEQSVDEVVAGRMLAGTVSDLLGELSSAHRTVLELRFIEQLSVGEVADVLEMSEPAVRALTMRARRAAETVAHQQGLSENRPLAPRSVQAGEGRHGRR